MNSEPMGADPAGELPESQAGAPLLSDFGAAEEMQSGSMRSNKSRRIGVAALILLGAAGGIFVMRTIGLGAASVLAAIVVDYDPSEFTKGPGDPAVLDELARSRMAVQVPSEVFEHDPFYLGDGEEVAVDEGPVREREPELSAEERARRALEQRVQTAVGEVNVQSVMGGRIKLAKVNGRMVRVGDRVLDVLMVQQIEGRVVVFKGGESLYAFEMGEPGVKWKRSLEEETPGGP